MSKFSQALFSKEHDELFDDGPHDDDTTLEDHPDHACAAKPTTATAEAATASTERPESLTLDLKVRDREVVEALLAHPEGRRRSDFALDALRIGVLALRHANSQVDSELIRNASAELMENLQKTLQQYSANTQEKMGTTLKDYFDPENGRFNERIQRLLSKDGELDRVLSQQLHGEGSQLAKTLDERVGKESPLMKLLDPDQSKGMLASMRQVVDGELTKQRDQVLREFSLDNQEGALARLIQQLTSKHGDLSKDLKGKIDEVVKEFSLDKEDSALSNLVRNVERAQRKITDEFSLDNDRSALSRVKWELTTILEAHVKTNAEFQEEVKVTLAKLSQKRESDAKSTEHGNVFEEAVYQFLQNESEQRGDIAEFTGNTTGAVKNCKVGDVVLQLGPDTPAAGCRIVFEAKDDRSYRKPKALEELGTARKNRGAHFGVFVFGKASAPEGMKPLSRYHNDLLVVWDAEDPGTDPYLLAALEIARACSIEFGRGGDEAEEVDIDGFEAVVHEIEKRAANLDLIRKPAETIRSSSDKILDRVRIEQTALEKQVAHLREHVVALRSVSAKS